MISLKFMYFKGEILRMPDKKMPAKSVQLRVSLHGVADFMNFEDFISKK